MPANITIVIPYYQKQRGILKKAVLSVLQQKFTYSPPVITIIVVDDSSPVPARDELTDIDYPPYCTISVIQQKNAGPACARNTALDHVPEGTDFVSFLDSDDVWTDDHLDNALQALGSDMNFYFSDHYQLNQEISAFNRARRINIKDHTTLAGHNHLYLFEKDMFNQILTGNIIGTSTVVYRFSRFPGQRFREHFFNAGEDYLFWLDLVSQDQRIVFSSRCEAIYGPGVNIFSGTVWGTEQSLDRIFFEIKYLRTLLKEFNLQAHQRDMLNTKLRSQRHEYCKILLHRARHLKRISLKRLFDHLIMDPMSFAGFPSCILKVMNSR